MRLFLSVVLSWTLVLSERGGLGWYLSEQGAELGGGGQVPLCEGEGAGTSLGGLDGGGGGG